MVFIIEFRIRENSILLFLNAALAAVICSVDLVVSSSIKPFSSVPNPLNKILN
jgi:hypothetical protein